MTDSSAGWQTYAHAEANNIKADVAADHQADLHGGAGFAFADQWVKLSPDQQASTIGALGREAKAGDQQAMAALHVALDDSRTPSTSDLNTELKKLGFNDVAITNDQIVDSVKDYKGLTVNGANGEYFHTNAWGETIADHNPAYGNGQYFANGAATSDYARTHGAQDYVPTDAEIAAASKDMAAKSFKL